MFTHRFGRILLSQGTLKVTGALFELCTHRRLRIFKLPQGLEVSLHLVSWNRDLAPKNACHPSLPLHTSIVLEVSTLMIFLSTVLLCAVGQDKIKQKQCDSICGNDNGTFGCTGTDDLCESSGSMI